MNAAYSAFARVFLQSTYKYRTELKRKLLCHADAVLCRQAQPSAPAASGDKQGVARKHCWDCVSFETVEANMSLCVTAARKSLVQATAVSHEQQGTTAVSQSGDVLWCVNASYADVAELQDITVVDRSCAGRHCIL